jgi:molybdate transport system substrate-binding protein
VRVPGNRWAGAAAAAALVVVGAGLWLALRDGSDGSADRLRVLAAASLTDVLPAIDPAPVYSFSGSNALAVQIESGAPADVFASADASIPARLHAEGLVELPVPFARNSLVVIVPRGNPADVRSVDDLARPGVTVVVAQEGVPVGGYTRSVLAKLGLETQVLRNVVSRETDVRAVLSMVALGQADAGFVYATDARQAADRVRVVPIPEDAQPRAAYAVAVVSASPRRAQARAFVRALLDRSGRSTLARYGFTPCCAAQPTPGPRRAVRVPG